MPRDDANELTIRTARAEDLPALRAVYRASSLANDGDREALLAHPEHLDFAGEHLAGGRTRLAEDADGIAGFATVVPGDGGAHELEDMFVAPSRMRRGIGAALVRDAVERVRAEGGTRIEVVANDHARAFYEACGFTGWEPVETALGAGRRMSRVVADGGTAPVPGA